MPSNQTLSNTAVWKRKFAMYQPLPIFSISLHLFCLFGEQFDEKKNQNNNKKDKQTGEPQKRVGKWENTDKFFLVKLS